MLRAGECCGTPRQSDDSCKKIFLIWRELVTQEEIEGEREVGMNDSHFLHRLQKRKHRVRAVKSLFK